MILEEVGTNILKNAGKSEHESFEECAAREFCEETGGYFVHGDISVLKSKKSVSELTIQSSEAVKKASEEIYSTILSLQSNMKLD